MKPRFKKAEYRITACAIQGTAGAACRGAAVHRLGRLSFRLLVCLCLLISSSQALAQSSRPTTPQAAPVIRVSTQLVILDAFVQNKKTGELIGTLGAEDLEVYEDDVLQPISYFSRDQLPLSVVLLFDLTDTVRPVLKVLADAAQEILGHLKPQDEVAILVFSSHTEVLQDFTTDRSLAAAAIEKASEMKSGEGTFIHEDMYEAVQQAVHSTIPGSRRALVWLTDGTSNLENSFTQKTIGKSAPVQLHTKAQATESLLRAGVAVSALIERSAMTDALITTGNLSPLFFLLGARLGDVKKYAEITGGPVLNTSKKEAAARLALLIDELRSRYAIGYYPVNARPEGFFCTLKVKLRPEFFKQHPGLRDADIIVHSKRGYYR